MVAGPGSPAPPERKPARSRYALPELLAPAGSWDMLVASVASGADAVYLGGRFFGARHYADNFADASIPEVVSYAHLRGVKVYITVNTLVFEDELSQIPPYLLFLYESGVDGVLVQDLGVLSIIREVVPGLPVHASTQMTIHNSKGVVWAASKGIQRIVASRELSLQEIDDLVRAGRSLGVGIEVFVHGALCYAYSGQCLFSSMAGGRSGNRGMCAQPCRRRYELISAKYDLFGRPIHQKCFKPEEPYLLSTRDLCTLHHLPAIVGSGVCALKIEGRMRSPAYAATVTSIYRKALDDMIRGDFHPAPDDEDQLALAFSRGFTGGYLVKESGNTVMGRDRPDDRGIEIGKVIKRETGIVEVGLIRPIRLLRQDGLVIRDRDGSEEGLVCREEPRQGQKTAWLVTRKIHRPGARVFLTSRKMWSEWFIRLMEKPDRRKSGIVTIGLTVRIEPEQPVRVHADVTDAFSRNFTLDFTSVITMRKAISRPVSQEQLIKHLTRSGHSVIKIRSLDLQYAGDLFAPLSVINGIRREILAKVESELLARHLPPEKDVHDAQSLINITFQQQFPRERTRSGHEVAVMVSTPDSLIAALLAGCKKVFYQFRFTRPVMQENDFSESSCSAEDILQDILPLSEECLSRGVWFGVMLPRIIDDRMMALLQDLFPRLVSQGVRGALYENPWIPSVFLSLQGSFEWVAGTGCNITNSRAAEELGPVCTSFIVSHEVSGLEIGQIWGHSTKTLAMIVQGLCEVMVTRDPLWEVFPDKAHYFDHTGFSGIRDETGRIFPVSHDPGGRVVIQNAVETSLVDQIPALVRSGVVTFLIDARGRPPGYVHAAVRLYQDALASALSDGSCSGVPAETFRQRAREFSFGGITYGHFHRKLSSRQEEVKGTGSKY